MSSGAISIWTQVFSELCWANWRNEILGRRRQGRLLLANLLRPNTVGSPGVAAPGSKAGVPTVYDLTFPSNGRTALFVIDSGLHPPLPLTFGLLCCGHGQRCRWNKTGYRWILLVPQYDVPGRRRSNGRLRQPLAAAMENDRGGVQFGTFWVAPCSFSDKGPLCGRGLPLKARQLLELKSGKAKAACKARCGKAGRGNKTMREQQGMSMESSQCSPPVSDKESSASLLTPEEAPRSYAPPQPDLSVVPGWPAPLPSRQGAGRVRY